jgi:hypothetical protein
MNQETSGKSILQEFSGITQQNYYFGRSLTKLFLFNLVQALLVFRRRGPSRKLLKPLRQLKGSKTGQIALVLGNGPSLNRINLEDILKHSPDVFVLNDYYMKDLAKVLKPSFYCLSDPDSFYQPERNVRHSNSSAVAYMEENNCTLLISHLYRKVDLGTKCKSLYFNDRELSIFNRNINPLRIRGYSSLTILKSLSIAVFLGYSQIYILGVDNTEHRALIGDKNNDIWLRTDKLYEDNASNPLNYPLHLTSGLAGKFSQYATWFNDFSKFPCDRIINLDLESIIEYFPKSDVINLDLAVYAD